MIVISPALKVRLNLRRRIFSTTCGAAGIVSSFGRGRGRVFVIALAGMHFLGVALNVVGLGGAHGGFVPVVVGKIVLNVDLGLGHVAVDFGIDQRERDLGHAGRLALARAREDDVLHVDAAQQSRRLLAQHPGDGVGNVRLAAAVRTDDGGNAVALEAKVGAVTERFETEDLQLLQFEQLSYSVRIARAGSDSEANFQASAYPRFHLDPTRNAKPTVLSKARRGQDVKHHIWGRTLWKPQYIAPLMQQTMSFCGARVSGRRENRQSSFNFRERACPHSSAIARECLIG